MKIRLLTGAFLLSGLLGIYAFTATEASITGKVTPADAASTVWAVNATDSVKSTIANGSFTISVKAGTYKVIVDAIDPYKDETIENVQVADGAPTDLGEIKLKQ